MKTEGGARTTGRGVGLVLAVVVLAVIVRSAWVGDDAFITMRSVDHLVRGYGPVYNVGERAQSFTHPLWMMALSVVYGLWRDPFLAPIALGVVCSAATLVVLARRLLPSEATGLLLALGLSRAWVDYGTSGLENPLTHLLYAALLVSWLGPSDADRRLRWVAIWGGLMALNRLDTALLAAPVVGASALSAWREGVGGRRVGRALVVGAAPLVAWEAFSLIYYGMWVPLSALSKLHSGLSSAEVLRQGALYYAFQLDWDPITLVVAVAGPAMALWRGERGAPAVAVGIGLYLAYVLRIGGDFMGGRFFTAPMLGGLVLLGRSMAGGGPWAAAGVYAGLLAVGMAGMGPPLLPETDRPFKHWDPRGVADERAYYVGRGAGIGVLRHDAWGPQIGWRYEGLRLPPGGVKEHTAAGYPAFYAHTESYWLNRYGLVDPLIARLPPRRVVRWRIGHFERVMPPQLFDSLRERRNLLEDPEAARLLDAVWTVHRGPLWSWDRWTTLWNLHRGLYDVTPGRWRYPDPAALPAPEEPWDRSSDLRVSDGVEVNDEGAILELDGLVHDEALAIRRRDDVRFDVVLERSGVEVWTGPVRRVLPYWGRLEWTSVQVPSAVARGGYDTVRLLPVSGPKPWVVQRIHLGSIPNEE